MPQDSSLNPFPASAGEVAERAASVLAPESGLFEDLDAAGFGDAVTKAIRAALSNPLGAGAGRVPAGRRPGPDPAGRGDPLVRPGDRAAGHRSTPRTGASPIRPGRTTRCSTGSGWPTWSSGRFFRDVVAASQPGSGLRAQGHDVRRPDAGRGRPDQLPADQPGRAQAGLRHRRSQPGQGRPAVPRRPGQQRGPAAPGGRQRLRGGPQPGLHPGQGRLPQRADGAHPVRAADRAGARHPAALQPAVDQQVLRDGPGPGSQLHRVGGQARAHRVRDQLPQPAARTCPAPPWTTT